MNLDSNVNKTVVYYHKNNRVNIIDIVLYVIGFNALASIVNERDFCFVFKR